MQIVIPYRIPGLPVIPWLRAAVRTNAVQQFPRLDAVLWADREAFRQEMYSRYPALRPGQVELILGWPWPDPEPTLGSPWSDGWSDGFGNGYTPPSYTHELTPASLATGVVGFTPTKGALIPDTVETYPVYALEFNGVSNFVRLTFTGNAQPYTSIEITIGTESITLVKNSNRYQSNNTTQAAIMYQLVFDSLNTPLPLNIIGTV